MTIFYWTMAVLILGTLVPAVLSFLVFAASGNDVFWRRAKGLWTASRLFTMFGLNILIWGHVVVGLWQVWFN